MTKEEVSQKYSVPLEVLEEYANWGLCSSVKEVMNDWQYNETDLERLSMIMTLHETGFDSKSVEKYIKLMLKGKSTENERLLMLTKRRNESLDEIHFKEKQISCLDYLRHKIKS